VDAVLARIRKHGLATVGLVAVAWYANELRKDAAADRHDYALLLMQEINEVQAQVEKACK